MPVQTETQPDHIRNLIHTLRKQVAKTNGGPIDPALVFELTAIAEVALAHAEALRDDLERKPDKRLADMLESAAELADRLSPSREASLVRTGIDTACLWLGETDDVGRRTRPPKSAPDRRASRPVHALARENTELAGNVGRLAAELQASQQSVAHLEARAELVGRELTRVEAELIEASVTLEQVRARVVDLEADLAAAGVDGGRELDEGGECPF